MAENKKQIIRNIPIFIESRNETIINDRPIDEQSHAHEERNSNIHEPPQQSKTKSQERENFPEKNTECSSNNIRESSSPFQNSTPSARDVRDSRTPDKHVPTCIEKIQAIQSSVLDLMGKVENYNGENPKEYVYLDEMLTQNLLKLDNIDVEGKDDLKSARREAIKCIQSLITLLESKNEEFSKK
jgi:BCL2-associated athanogene 3